MGKKKNDPGAGAYALMIVLGALALGFYWLYVQLGPWGFTALMAALVGLMVYGFFRLSRPEAADLAAASSRAEVPNDAEFLRRDWLVGDWFNHDNLQSARDVEHGWNRARLQCQKTAYEITRPSHPHAQKDWFRAFMTQFVARDPIYQDTIGRVHKAVAENPGLLQSQIFKDRTEKEKEGARYVLYFAAELGDIRREKSGRSYRLYPSDPSHDDPGSLITE